MLLYGGSVNIQPIYYYVLHRLKALVSFGPVIKEVKYLFVSKSWLLENGTSEVLNQEWDWFAYMCTLTGHRWSTIP